MLGFVRKILYRTASALEKQGDETCWFVESEARIGRRPAADLLLKVFERKSPETESKFRTLVDEAARADSRDIGAFKIAAAVSGASFFTGLSGEACEYLLEKAYRQGASLRVAKEKQRMLRMGLGVVRNSMYGLCGYGAWKTPSSERGSVSVGKNGEILVTVAPGAPACRLESLMHPRTGSAVKPKRREMT